MRKVASSFMVILLLLQMFLFAGCEVKRPSGIMSQGKMVDVLCDYHIARALGENLPPNESYKTQLYIDAVFKKYGITQQDFNTSMAWYSRNTEDLAKVYEEVQKRLNTDLEETNKLISSTVSSSVGTASGDSLDLWTFSRTARLNGDDMNNKVTFTITTDSTFHERDAFEWSVGFICSGSSDMMHAAVMSLTVRYMNDSVVTQSIPIMSSGLRQLRVQNDTLGMVRDVRGFIYLPKGASSVLVAEVKYLKRYHAHAPVPAKQPANASPIPTTPTATATAPNATAPTGAAVTTPNGAQATATDTAKAAIVPPHRLTPEELNKKRNDTGTPRGYQIRQQALEKELQEKRNKSPHK